MAIDVKICGITRRADAEVAADAGARYIGAVLVPGSPRKVLPELAGTFCAGLDVELVIVVADEATAEVVEWAGSSGASVVQLHGSEPPQVVRDVRNAGDWEVWKAVGARDVATVHRAVEAYGAVADAVLVDGWHPDRIGGTGVTVGWSELTDLRERLRGRGRLIAAGGLTPENVGPVVALARPHVVDVSSGVEQRPGHKDPERVRAFVRAARTAERQRSANGREGR